MEERETVLELPEEEIPETEMEVTETQAEEIAEEAPVQKKRRKFLNGKVLAIVCCAALVLVAVFLMIGQFGGSGADNYGLFFKDKELFLTSVPGEAPYAVTRQFSMNDNLDNDEYVELAEVIGEALIVRKNGSRIFFPDKIAGNNLSSGVTMYYRDLDGKNGDPVKIDSEIVEFHVSEDGKWVVYLKGYEGKLYVHDLKGKTRIATGVTEMTVSDDCSRIGYLTDEDNFYIWEKNGEPTKLAIDVESAYYDPARTDFFFIKEGALYRQQVGTEERVKIDEDVNYVAAVYDSGKVYYVKENVQERKLTDYVTDDLLESDKKMPEPEWPDYPSKPVYPYSWRYNTTMEYQEALSTYDARLEEYEKTVEKMEADYEEACLKYDEKLMRDVLREELKEGTKKYYEYSLYYYDGSQSILMTEAMTSKNSLRLSDQRAVAQYSVYSATEIPKVKLSDIERASEVSKMIEEALYSVSDVYVTVGSNAVRVGESGTKRFAIPEDGSCVYYLDELDEQNVGDLYRMTIDTELSTAGTPELYDTEVCGNFGLWFLNGESRIVYAKGMSGTRRVGDLYIAGQLLDYDVALDHFAIRDDMLVYFTDWNSIKEFGTLQIKKIGEENSTMIGEEIHDFTFSHENDILYLDDYSTKYCAGVLHFYDVEKAESGRITYDVTALVDLAE